MKKKPETGLLPEQVSRSKALVSYEPKLLTKAPLPETGESDSSIASTLRFDSVTISDALTKLTTNDTGDETQRNFRYQHAYGVILLVAGATHELPYSAIWCEWHEDFLAERSDGTLDAIQVKTRKPEQGEWTLRDEEVVRTIKRFVTMEKALGKRVHQFQFVSNVEESNSSAAAKLERSPRPFLSAIASCDQYLKLPPPFKASFSELRRKCKCQSKTLFACLQKLVFLKGPGRDSFDSEICQTVLPALPGHAKHSPAEYQSTLDDLIQKVYRASSLATTDPSKFWKSTSKNVRNHPKFLGKQIPVEIVLSAFRDTTRVPFSYLPTANGPLTTLGVAKSQSERTSLKMLRGGLGPLVETMQERAIAAEYSLIEMAHATPANGKDVLQHLESLVKGECDDAFAAATSKADKKAIGVTMYNRLVDRLREIAKEEPQKAANMDYEVLMGLAGILTGACRVWWSKKFKISQASKP